MNEKFYIRAFVNFVYFQGRMNVFTRMYYF